MMQCYVVYSVTVKVTVVLLQLLPNLLFTSYVRALKLIVTVYANVNFQLIGVNNEALLVNSIIVNLKYLTDCIIECKMCVK